MMKDFLAPKYYFAFSGKDPLLADYNGVFSNLLPFTSHFHLPFLYGYNI